jgi:hypothetical protein
MWGAAWGYDVFIPFVFGVAVDSISVCLEMEIGSGLDLTSQMPRCSSIVRIT